MWDGNGHGTHCAGVITGHRWGAAKQAKVRAIKVLSDEGEGATSYVSLPVPSTLQIITCLKKILNGGPL